MNLAIIGLGNMGQAILDGILKAEVLELNQITAADKKIAEPDFKLPPKYQGLKITADNKEAAAGADYLILAVKPQLIKTVLEELKNDAGSKVIISIAAGVKTKLLARYFGSNAKLVRVMPNTPALAGEGVSALYFTEGLKTAEKEFVEKIFGSFGLTVRTAEEDMDAVTGLSGSGPAYVYLFIEALAEAGVLKGLKRETALKLAAQTVKGGAEMVLKTGLHPAELKDMVCSSAGTTIEGVAALEENSFRSAVIKAVSAAADRSQELGR